MKSPMLLPWLLAAVWHFFFVVICTESFAPPRISRQQQQQQRIHFVPSVARLPLETTEQDHHHHHEFIPLGAASTTTTAQQQQTILVDWDGWWIERIETWYSKALAIKCPFLRRRLSDMLETIDAVLRNGLLHDPTRMGPPLAYRCEGDTCAKAMGITLAELCAAIRKDWREDTNKGYYITGKINTSLYRDDCIFDGPDPDMPVRGLRKYLNAASQLFDPSKSTCELLSLQTHNGAVVATWRIRGRMRLPWKPDLPVVTGKTTYYRDLNGLIYLHKETWDISVFRAFLETFWPDVAHRVWKREANEHTYR